MAAASALRLARRSRIAHTAVSRVCARSPSAACSVSTRERHDVAARLGSAEGPRRRWPELQAIAGREVVLDVVLAHAQTPLEHPDLLVDEGVGVRGIADLGARGQAHLHELER